MGARWEQDFDVYMGEIEDAPASFVIDVQAANHAPVGSHPLLLIYNVPMRTPTESGLRDGSEFEALSALEDQVVENLVGKLDAIYVGRVVHDGDTTLYFYLPSLAEEELERIADVAGKVEPYEPEWSVEDDEEWQCCTEFLSPDDYSRQSMQNRRLLGVMQERGDQLQVARTIDHFAYFPSEEATVEATARLTSAGFSVDAPRAPEEEDEMWAIEFHRDDAPGDGGADLFCEQILEIVLELDGVYDGWGAPVVEG